MSELQPLRRTIRGGRAFFFSDPAVDKVLNMVVTLAGEVWALRERLAALEGIGVRQGSLAATEVDDYEFTPEQEERLGAQRKEFIESLFRVIEEQVEAAVAKRPKSAPVAPRMKKAAPRAAAPRLAKAPKRAKTGRARVAGVRARSRR